MRIRFITHFDSSYTAQGMAMMKSLLQFGHHDITILPLDNDVFPTMLKVGIPCGFYSLSDVEKRNPRLIEIRKDRSRRNWAFTLEPAWCEYNLWAMDEGDIIVYLDADQFFFADPVPTIRSVMEHADVALSPHYFPAGHEKPSVGKFNFGFGVFCACDLTRRIVGEWLDKTLERCDETVNDQMYLDSWAIDLGDRLAELQQSINCAPWQNPHVVQMSGHPMLNYGLTLGPLVSYHFHEFRRGTGRNPVTIKGIPFNRTNYELHPSTIESVYKKYESELERFL